MSTLPAPNRDGLTNLEAAIRRDLDRLNYPARGQYFARTTTTGEAILDCLIIGGGQGGVAVGIGLKLEKAGNFLIVDRNPRGLEGPWRTFARMHTLRTPKHLTGPDHGIPNLTARAWFEAQYGEAAWQNLSLIPKETWAEYVTWLRDFFALPVENRTEAGAIEWRETENCFAVPLSPVGDNSAPPRTVFARTVVLATGIDGSGQWQVPAMIRESLPAKFYAHTRNEIDFAALRGKRVAVLGAGASAFDNASVALETGAAEVRVFFRREELPNVNPYRWAEFTGFLRHHAELSDADRWRFIQQILRMGQLPPADTFERATQHANFHLHGGCPWEAVALTADEAVTIATPKGEFIADFLIVGTGFVTDLTLRPELAKIESHIARWHDRYSPPAADANADLARHPYLGPHFEFVEKRPGEAPWVAGIFNYTFGGLPSLGFGGASISGMKYSLPRIVGGITRHLFLADAAAHFDSLATYDVREF